MALRTRYLVAYDVREPRRLRRVHSVAKDYGEPLQYSVFVCDLTQIELVDVKQALLDEMDTTQDSVSILDLGSPAGRGLECIEFLGTRRPLPETGPEIW